jgi:hypothetical protein
MGVPGVAGISARPLVDRGAVTVYDGAGSGGTGDSTAAGASTNTPQDDTETLTLAGVEEKIESLGSDGRISLAGVTVDSSLRLRDTDLPETFVTADRKAIWAQRLFGWTMGIEQVLLILSAAAALVAAPDIVQVTGIAATADGVPIGNLAGIIVAGALLAAVAVRSFRSSNHPDSDWYHARALAEAVRSQAWRYTMRVTPYDDASVAQIGAIGSGAELRLVEQVQKLRDASQVQLPAARGKRGAEQISDTMRRLRNADPAQRIKIYLSDRLDDQAGYYRRKAERSERLAQRWNVAILVIEGIALAAAAAANIPGVPHVDPRIDVYGLASTIIASAAVWLQVKQYATLARRYSAMARNLKGYVDALKYNDSITPEAWGVLVDNIEQLVEHEHEGWLHLYQSLKFADPNNSASLGATQTPDGQVRGTPVVAPTALRSR